MLTEINSGRRGFLSWFLKFFLLGMMLITLPPVCTQAAEKMGSVDLSTAIIQVAKQAIPAVVAIEITERREVTNPFWGFEQDPSFRRFFNMPKMPRKFKQEMKGLGSGIIIDAQGHIITNYHVAGGATKIQVVLSNGNQYPAKFIGGDSKTDLAVIQISAGEPLPHINFGDSDQLEVGEWVVAIGAPRALEKTVTQGIVSAKHRGGISDPSSYQDFLQTDAAINPGNSGGPLLNLRGEVIGVNAAIATESGGFEGIGFTIPSNMAAYVSKALIAHGKVQRGWLGLSIRNLTPEIARSLHIEPPKGALIADVVKGGPAEKAGLRKNDVVVAYQGKEIPDSGTFRNEVAVTPIKEEARVTVMRDGKKQEFTVKIGNLEDGLKIMAGAIKDRLGAEVRPVAQKEVEKYGLNSNEGVVITWLDPKGPLKEAGFELEDIILAINDQTIQGMESFINLVSALKPNQKLSVLALDHRTGNVGTILVAIGVEHHFRKARESFLQNDLKDAASEIRKASKSLNEEKDQAVEKGKEALTTSTHELERLADEVEKGTLASVQKLEEVFGRAYQALTGQR